MKTMLGLLLIAAVLIAAPGDIEAKTVPIQNHTLWQSGMVTYDSPVEGQVDHTAFTQTWSFQTETADRITIRVERLTGNLIPDVNLLDANGQNVASSYGATPDNLEAVIENFTLPSANLYQIAVGREGGETGVTSGTYRLTVIPVALAPDHPNNTAVVGPVTLDGSVTGEVTPTHWRNVFTLDAEATDLIRIRVERLSGTLFPEVELLDPSGTLIATGYVDAEGDTAEIPSYNLPGAGQYQIVVTRAEGQNDHTRGTFELSVTLLGSGEDSSRLKRDPKVIEFYDTPVQGALTNVNWYEDWQFRTEADDIVTITVVRFPEDTPESPNNLQPMVILLGAAGQELQRGFTDYTGAGAEIARFHVEGAGTYTARVTRNQEKGGLTVGTYELTVTLDGSGLQNPNLATVTGEITPGTPVTGTVTHARWADSWTYTSEAGGEQLNITATRTEGSLIPRIEIRDSNGSSLNSVYPDPSADVAHLTGFTVPAAGEYRIIVFREGDQAGYTTGSYSLLVEATPAQ